MRILNDRNFQFHRVRQTILISLTCCVFSADDLAFNLEIWDLCIGDGAFHIFEFSVSEALAFEFISCSIFHQRYGSSRDQAGFLFSFSMFRGGALISFSGDLPSIANFSVFDFSSSIVDPVIQKFRIQYEKCLKVMLWFRGTVI